MFPCSSADKTQYFIKCILPKLTKFILLKHAIIRKQSTAPTKKAAGFNKGDASLSPIETEHTHTPSPVVQSVWAWGIAGMVLTGTNQYTCRKKKPVLVPKLYPPQIPRGLTWDRNWTSPVRRRRLLVSTAARPESHTQKNLVLLLFCKVTNRRTLQASWEADGSPLFLK
jgi:hypothetical protein